MNIDDKEKYIIINCDNLKDLNPLISYLTMNCEYCPHLIINLLKTNIDKDIIVSTLSPFYLNWQKRNKSFILVSKFRKKSTVDIISIQSVEEAIDFFHMEDLTRNI